MGPQDPRLSSPAERERNAVKDKGTGGQYVAVCSVSNSPLTYNPFETLSQPFRIKCERYYLPNPSARAGYDTRSIFKRSLTGLNSESSFS